MSIMKLKGYEAEAVVQGMLRQVEYHEDRGLLIKGLRLEDAHNVLDALATKTIVAIRPEAILTPSETKSVEPPTVQTKQEKPAPKKEKAEAAPKEKAEIPPAVKELVEEKPSAPAKPVQAAAPVAPTPAPAPVENKKPDNIVPIETKRTPDAVVPFGIEELTKATKLRDLLAILMDKGITTNAALIAECERVKADVPLLTRIVNISERVTRTLEVMQDKSA